ncbi:MAG: DNA/RNA nuclease SfsA [Candidatus Puniceispirillum sp.]|nr:DNA/RNA nuclease SfsA [Candidatus Puniceispirillum sp.]
MEFMSPLEKGRLVKRYKRFLADVILEDGSLITAHCPNSGSMLGVKEEGATVWLSKSDNPKRRLAYTWELIEVDGALVCVHTTQANKVVEEALLAKTIEPLAPYTHIRREVAYGTNSRIDFLLTGEGLPDVYLEVKSVTLKREGMAQFPDAVTTRGQKHMEELARMVTDHGARACLLYVVQRPDAQDFSLARDIDPAYAKAAARAKLCGVEELCYGCDVTTMGVTLTRPLHIINEVTA